MALLALSALLSTLQSVLATVYAINAPRTYLIQY